MIRYLTLLVMNVDRPWNESRPIFVPPEFETHNALLPTGVRLSYFREGEGYPLVLLHGYPETKRIWVRNITALAAAGFDVIAPDLRGYGQSSLAPDGYYDTAVFATDVGLLLKDELGIERCAIAGGDIGSGVAIEMTTRFPGLVERMCLFNGACPVIPDRCEAAGVPPVPSLLVNPAADYYLRQGFEPDRLLAELNTPSLRREYVAAFYSHRLWAPTGSFTAAEVDYMTEPFADAARLRASWVDYEVMCERRKPSEPEHLSEQVDTPTVILYGPLDPMVPAAYLDLCALAFSNCIGPFTVAGTGHFLQWEKPHILNATLTWFLADLRERQARFSHDDAA
jgi:pimeloyl-ACP methyl ester carboxylesterase